MSITTFSDIAILPAGMNARLGTPEAIFGGEANATGDATGGVIIHGFVLPTGLELDYVLVVDTVSFETDTAVGTPDRGRVSIVHHHELANQTLENTRTTFVELLGSGTTFLIDGAALTKWLRAFPIWWRRDLGGTQGERLISRLSADNIDLQVYRFRIMGRVYDARVLASPDFWRLFESVG